MVGPITISDHYSIFLSIGNLVRNRNNKPNALAITTIEYSILQNCTEFHTRIHRRQNATQCFINTLKNLIKSASSSRKISSKLKKIKL